MLYSSRTTCIDPQVKTSRSRSRGYKNRQGRTVASDMCCYGRVLLLPAWVCMSIRLPTFSSLFCVTSVKGLLKRQLKQKQISSSLSASVDF